VFDCLARETKQSKEASQKKPIEIHPTMKKINGQKSINSIVLNPILHRILSKNQMDN